MADYNNSLALMVRPPQFDLGRTMLQAGAIQGQQTQNDLAQFQLGQGQERANALKQFGQTDDLNALKTQPDLFAQMVQTRGQLDDQKRKTFDTNIMRNAQGAQRVASIADPAQRQQAWTQEIDTALKEGRIDQATHDRMASTAPSDLVLHNIVKSGLTIQQQIDLEQKEKDRGAGAAALDALGAVVGGGGAAPQPAPGPMSAAPSSNAPALARSESGGNPRAVNQLGYAGTYQFGAPRLADLGVYTPGANENIKAWSKTAVGTGNKWTGKFNVPGFPEVKTVDQFLANPQAQEAAFKLHTAKTDYEIAQGGLDRFVGQTVAGVPITRDGLRNMIHLGGAAGTQKFLESGGRVNPKDANGTSLLDYARLGSGGENGQSTAANMQNFGSTIAGVPTKKLLPMLMAVAGAPGLPKETRDVAMEMLKTGLAESKPTNDQKEYLQYVQQELQAGRAPKSLFDYQVALKQAGSTKVTIGEGAKAVQKGLGERYLKAEDAATTAAGEVRMYETIDRLLDDPNVYTGTAGETIASLKKAGQTLLGLNFKGVGNAEVAKKITDELALAFKAQSSDPSTSNYERQIYERMATGLSDSAQGRKLLVQFRISDLNHKQEQANIWRQYLGESGEVDPKVFEALARLEVKRREKLGEFMAAANTVAGETKQPAPSAGAENALDQLMKKYKDIEP